jgi:hypothetical protein
MNLPMHLGCPLRENLLILLEEEGRSRSCRQAPFLELVLTTGERLRIGAGVDGVTLRAVLDALRA